MNINFKKINLTEILEYFAKRFFVIFLFFSFLAFMFAGIIFYKYGYSAENSEPNINERDLKINADNYQKMINFWQAREEVSNKVDTKEFKTLF